MLDVIYLLTAVQIFAKDAHYNFKGVGFMSLHKWMDEITDPIYDFVDEIKEQIMLRKGVEIPRGTVINHESAFYVPSELGGDNKQILSNLHALLSMAHQTINDKEWETQGVGDLMGRIDSHLQKHIGLLNLALGE